MAPQRDRRNLKNLLIDKIPFIAVAFVFVLLTIYSQSMTREGVELPTSTGAFWILCLLCSRFLFNTYACFPACNLSAVYAPAIKSGIDIEVAWLHSLLLLIMALGIFLYHCRRDLLFWLALFFIGLLPVSQIVPIVTLMNDRYLYFLMLGAAAFIVSIAFLAINKVRKDKSLVRAAAAWLFCCFSVIILLSRMKGSRPGRMKMPCGRTRS